MGSKWENPKVGGLLQLVTKYNNFYLSSIENSSSIIYQKSIIVGSYWLYPLYTVLFLRSYTSKLLKFPEIRSCNSSKLNMVSQSLFITCMKPSLNDKACFDVYLFNL